MCFRKGPELVVLGCALGLVAAGQAAWAENLIAASPTNDGAGNLGIFGGLDPRSVYNRDFFPQPLLVDDTGLAEGELEFGSVDTQAGGERSDLVTAGGQKGFGLLTFELTVPYLREVDAGEVSQGIGNLELGVRYPLYQWLSASGCFDTTLGVGAEVGIPVNSTVSKNAEFDPKVFNDLKWGDHFSVQTVFGYATLFGGGGGLQTFEYGLAFGYALPRAEVPIPGVLQLTPLLELDGETQINQAERGENDLLGSLGFRMDIKPIGDVQPSLAIGYVFPVDSAARAEVHWGIATSLTLDF
jgi:hypothetical protein